MYVRIHIKGPTAHQIDDWLHTHDKALSPLDETAQKALAHNKESAPVKTRLGDKDWVILEPSDGEAGMIPVEDLATALGIDNKEELREQLSSAKALQSLRETIEKKAEKMEPDFEGIREALGSSEEPVGSIPRHVIEKTLRILEANWEKVKGIGGFDPETSVRHIRPQDVPDWNLPKAVEIRGNNIYLLNKGGKTPKLGTGKFKEVVEAIHLNTLKRYAAATICGPLDENSRTVTAREIRMQKKFSGDPHFVGIAHHLRYQPKKGGQEKFGVMLELCNGGDLFDALVDNVHSNSYGPLHFSLSNVLNVLEGMFSIIARLEEENVIDRDIKHENLYLVNDAGRLSVKKGDFGYTNDVEAEKERLKKGDDKSIKGTTALLSPEIVKSIVKQKRGIEDNTTPEQLCSPKVDVWAMGITLVELLTESKLNFLSLYKYAPNYIDKQIKKHLDSLLKKEKCLPALQNLDEEVLKELFDVIGKMLTVDQKERISGKEAKAGFDKFREKISEETIKDADEALEPKLKAHEKKRE